MSPVESRIGRYREKIELARERLEDVEILLEEFSKKFSRLACYKAFQEVVESLFDIIAMTLKDLGKTVEDDYTNIYKLELLEKLSREEAEILREANGLRNRVIHRYNRMDDEIARRSIETLLPHLRRILERLVEEHG